MIHKLINPFKYIAGGYALIIGIIILIATSITGYYSNIHFPDTISVKTSGNFPILYHIIQNLANWITISVIFYLFSVMASKSKVRIIDIFGTQALARAPYLIASFTGFSKSMENFGNYLLWELLKQGEQTDISTASIVIAILIIIATLLLTIWVVTLMFNAFKVSSNIKGAKLTAMFITGLIASMAISMIITNQLIKNF